MGIRKQMTTRRTGRMAAAGVMVAGLLLATVPLPAAHAVNGDTLGCWVVRAKTWKDSVKIGEVHTGSGVTGKFDYKNTNVTSIEGGISVDAGATWSVTAGIAVDQGVSSSLKIPALTHANVMSDFKFALDIHYCRLVVGTPAQEDYRQVVVVSAYGNQELVKHKAAPTNKFPNCRKVPSMDVTRMAAGGTWRRAQTTSFSYSKSIGVNASIKGLNAKASTTYTIGGSNSIANSYTSSKKFLVCGRGDAPQDVPVVAATSR